MPAYHYRAVNAKGRIARGQIAAANKSELAQHLGSTGLELIEARAKKETPARQSNPIHWPKRVSPRALPVFCAQITDLLKAGVAFVDALRDVTEATEPGPMRDALTDITRAVNHGGRIAEAFARAPRLFSPVFAAILDAGETSGDLPRTFARLTRYTEASAKTREQTRRALRYPLFLLVIAVGTITFMMTMVVPQIIQFLNSIDGELPVTTRMLIATSDFVVAGWWMIALAVIGALATVTALRRSSERAAKFIDGALLHMPLAGAMLRKIALARFVHSFAILYESGIGIVASLRSAKATLGNRVLEAMLDDAEARILSGSSLSSAMEGILPSFSLQIIRIGERSGMLGKSLHDIAETQDREVTALTERLIGSLEPALILFVGGLLAWIVLAVLGPIYGSLGKITGGG